MIEWQPDRMWYFTMPNKSLGIDLGARMTVIRLESGGLLVHNPIELTPEVKNKLAQLGTITAVTASNQSLHHYLSDWWLTFPEAYFFAPPGLALTRTDIGFDDALGSETPQIWKGELNQALLRGNDSDEEVVFYDPASKTLLMGESLNWFKQASPLTQVFGLCTGSYFSPGIPPSKRVKYQNHSRLRQSVQEILTWPFERILPVHGDAVEKDGRKYFAHAFHWVLNF